MQTAEDLEGSGRSLMRYYIDTHLVGLKKTAKYLRIFVVLAEIRIEHLPNTSLDSVSQPNLYCGAVKCRHFLPQTIKMI
jgi:hypothetical protein